MDVWLKDLCEKQGLTEVGVCKTDGGSVLVALSRTMQGKTPMPTCPVTPGHRIIM
ncbi:MAG: hypothetical protein II351_00985 [Clostridia bacterium]|nr:hypothetical protein [Clostridia bacterium]